MPRFSIGSGVESFIDWLQTHLTWLFDAISSVLTTCFDAVNDVLSNPDPLLMGTILAIVTLWLRGPVAAGLAMLGFLVIDSVELWDHAMMTLSMVLVCAVLTLIIAVPLGIWAARSNTVSAAVRPLLDFMQTMPAMIYLLPGVVFFGVGVTPGLLATVIFSMPPAVRMTELGIRQVDPELVEAAEAFGTKPGNTLRRVQLPLALPTIMAGVNQVIMLALSMVVIAGMAGASGLGEDVYNAVTRVEIGTGFEAGLAVVILAMYLDRMTAALNERISPLGRRAMAKAAAMASGWRMVHHLRPTTRLASATVVVLALLAAGLNFVGDDDTRTEADVNVGKGQQVKIGYLPWDEGIATSYLWKEVLERRGFEPTLQQYDPGPLFTALAKGDLDFQTDTWLPVTHEQYWEKFGDDLEDLGAWYGPTSLELTVPSYVEDVKSLADLKDHKDDFKGKIIGIEASAGEMAILKDRIVKEYGLTDWEIVSSSTATMLAELDRSIKKKEPVVVTLWSPHWAYNKYDLTKLEDPKGAWGKGDDIHITGKKDFAKDFPELNGWLKEFQMTEEDLASLEAEIQKGGQGKEKESARRWMDDRPGLVDRLAPVD